jgi:hypothetical protein
MEKRQPLQQMLLGKLYICMQKTKTRSMSFMLYKFHSKWIKDLNIRPETVKLVQERIGNTVEFIGKDFLSRTQMAQQLRERIYKGDYMKLENFCTTKEMVTRLKRQLLEWEKIFASYTSDKGLITRIYRELKQLNSPKLNDPMKKWANDSNRAFSKEEVKWQKKNEEILNISGHKGNAN